MKLLSETQVTLEMGEAYESVGNGGKFLLERVDANRFRVIGEPLTWIAYGVPFAFLSA